jgi:membrane fusion protein (multidrug efflux system)
MNPFAFVWRRPVTTTVLVLALTACSVAALDWAGLVAVPMPDLAKLESLLELDGPATGSEAKKPHQAEGASGESHHAHQKIVATSPKKMDVTLTQPYVCQIHSRRHIEVCALENGFLEEILVSEGQVVKKGDLMFKVLPTLYQARLDAEIAEARLAELEYNNTRKLADQKVVSENEVMLLQAKLAKAQAKVKLAQAELNFTNVAAPFDGIVDQLHKQLGSLIAEGDILTTLSDNSTMWVYFNVPEAAYLDYMATRDQHKEQERIELMLANGAMFSQVGKIGAIEAKFNNETGNIPFRADFPNPDRLLRHGQTGTVLIKRVLKDAIVIPQRATFELLDKRYVYVVSNEDGASDDFEAKAGSGHSARQADDDDGDDRDDDDSDEDEDDDDSDKDDDDSDEAEHDEADHGGDKAGAVVHQREIEVVHVLEDVFIVKPGILKESDRIVLEGVREVHDGEKIEYEYRKPEDILEHQKFHAE